MANTNINLILKSKKFYELYGDVRILLSPYYCVLLTDLNITKDEFKLIDNKYHIIGFYKNDYVEDQSHFRIRISNNGEISGPNLKIPYYWKIKFRKEHIKHTFKSNQNAYDYFFKNMIRSNNVNLSDLKDDFSEFIIEETKGKPKTYLVDPIEHSLIICAKFKMKYGVNK